MAKDLLSTTSIQTLGNSYFSDKNKLPILPWNGLLDPTKAKDYFL